MAEERMKWVPALVLCVAGCAGTSDSSYRGTLTWGHEVRAFKPCGGSAKRYWVVGDENLLRPLRDRSERGKPYQPIYVEVVGAIDTQSTRDGFAKDYDGIFRLRDIRQVSDVVPEECGK
jgi:hypothetical protein